MIIGSIDIEAVVIDPSGTTIESVKFFVDEDELASISYDSDKTVYSYTLDTRAIGVYTLKVSACDSENNELDSSELDIFIINLNFR